MGFEKATMAGIALPDMRPWGRRPLIIPPNSEIGYDREADAQRFTVTESGLVVIAKGMKLHASLDSPG